MTPGMPDMPRSPRSTASGPGLDSSARPCLALRIAAGRGVDWVRVTAQTVVRRALGRPLGGAAGSPGDVTGPSCAATIHRPGNGTRPDLRGAVDERIVSD